MIADAERWHDARRGGGGGSSAMEGQAAVKVFEMKDIQKYE